MSLSQPCSRQVAVITQPCDHRMADYSARPSPAPLPYHVPSLSMQLPSVVGWNFRRAWRLLRPSSRRVPRRCRRWSDCLPAGSAAMTLLPFGDRQPVDHQGGNNRRLLSLPAGRAHRLHGLIAAVRHSAGIRLSFDLPANASTSVAGCTAHGIIRRAGLLHCWMSASICSYQTPRALGRMNHGRKMCAQLFCPLPATLYGSA